MRQVHAAGLKWKRAGVPELKHYAVHADEIESGDECGLKLDFEDWLPEDLVECLEITSVKNKIAPPIFDMLVKEERLRWKVGRCLAMRMMRHSMWVWVVKGMWRRR